ncbi:MAG: CpaF family protein [Deltaproteobacteria bacterium]|nr:CpaF family protein [Deltaproteobacteria bacterium]
MISDMYDKSLRAFLKPVQKFLDDTSVSEIMINGPEDVWIERSGKLYRTDAKFTPEGVEAAGRNMAQFVGRIIDNERPRLDARLPDGSRIHVVMPPIARKGTTISIRKFFPGKLTIAQLIDFKSMAPEWARFIDACVITKQNVIVAGGTGSGKTTLLNVVSSLIPNDERILTIEDSAELQLAQDHLVPFEARPPDKQGRGQVTMADLLHSALRLRPDRIIIGEVRGGEAFDLMQSMNTGHSGSMCTVHANSPTETCRRIESLCLQSEIELPMVAIRSQVAAAINIVICCARFYDGSRRLTHIAEVLPLNEKGDYRTQDLFVYTVTGKDENGNIQGYHAPTGILPTFMKKLKAYGFEEMDESFFDPATFGYPRPPVVAIEEFKICWTSRLADGKEQWEPKELDPERKAVLDSALEAVRAERDLEPPPFFTDEPMAGEEKPETVKTDQDAAGDDAKGKPEAGRLPPKESSSGGKEASSDARKNSAARLLLRQGGTNSGARSKRLPLGVRIPQKPGRDPGRSKE